MSFQASSSDPSSPSTPTTRKNLYLPVRRPSLLESVLHMTKEISTNKSTNSSHDSPTNYPENESTESSYEKKTVNITTECLVDVFALKRGLKSTFINKYSELCFMIGSSMDNWRDVDKLHCGRSCVIYKS